MPNSTSSELRLQGLCLQLSKHALALYDRIEDRGLQPSDTTVTADLRAAAVALDDGLRGAIAMHLIDQLRRA